MPQHFDTRMQLVQDALDMLHGLTLQCEDEYLLSGFDAIAASLCDLQSILGSRHQKQVLVTPTVYQQYKRGRADGQPRSELESLIARRLLACRHIEDPAEPAEPPPF
jgi:hypothetical protein